MAQLTEHTVTKAAGLLADRLIEVYQAEQVGVLVNEFARAGFTRESLTGDPDVLYRFLVIAAYDRWPFTLGTGGYEAIWEMDPGSKGVPALMARAGLWSVAEIAALTDSAIQDRLSRSKLGGRPMNSDGETTNYVRTLRTILRYATSEFIQVLRQARTTTEIRSIHQTFQHGINGVGAVIASKLVKYLLREIQIGQARPADFPADVAWPLVKEWHAGAAADKFRRLHPDLIPRTAQVLEEKGDAYAIDALFYLQRNRPRQLDALVRSLGTL